MRHESKQRQVDMKGTPRDTRSCKVVGPSLELPAFGHGDPTKIRCGSHRSTSAKTPTEHHQRCAPPFRQAPERHCRRTPDPPGSKTNKNTVDSGSGTPSHTSAHSQQPTRPPFPLPNGPRPTSIHHPPPFLRPSTMPYYAKSEDWLHQSALLLQARPSTVRTPIQTPPLPTLHPNPQN